MSTGKKIWAYRRENGRVGVRNYVAILPVDDISNAACVAVANHIQGTIALPHAYGRLQFGEDLELHFRTMIGTGANPNVAACIVIGIEPHWTQKIVDGIAAPASRSRASGSRATATSPRSPPPRARPRSSCTRLRPGARRVRLEELWIAAKCGESDTTTGLASCPTVGNMYDKLIPAGLYGCFGETSELTGAEHLAAARAATPEVREKFMKTWQAYQDDVIEAHKTSDSPTASPPRATSRAASPRSRRRRSATSRRSARR